MKQKLTNSDNYPESSEHGLDGSSSAGLRESQYGLEDFSFRLKKRRKALGMSQKQLADAVKLSIKTIQKYEYGDTPKGPNLVRLSRTLHCSMDWLLIGTGPESSPWRRGDVRVCQEETELSMIPKVLARLNAGGGSLETSNNVKGMYSFRHDWIKQKGDPSKMILMDVSGDSMAPEIKDGDTVLVDQSQTNIYIGKIYAVSIGQEITVKYVERAPDKIILRSANRTWDDIHVDIRGDLEEAVHIVGRVIWWCREAK
jgi:phage repressor protein C with HTH and peptisase S24 domain